MLRTIGNLCSGAMRPGRSRWGAALLGTIVAMAGAFGVATAAAASKPSIQTRGEHGSTVVRAALPQGTIKHVVVIDLENESETSTLRIRPRRRRTSLRLSSPRARCSPTITRSVT